MPSSFADVTSGFHDGHSSLAARIENTISGSASICASATAVSVPRD
jgi:hypothetical protein